ncbi:MULTISPECIES: sigma-54-dependent Fis family transcriptional regulator [Mycobacteriaceae]|uniref:sigma-54-dependent Fis family transcriptional regulator n=1 Tax=Mycobacteriaceae TaxID=1762 RepID=UPI0009CC8DF1|nr:MULTISPECIES: helix-turn-helix domain-containing protein [Mycobacteriaceae]UCZ59704.1 Fis family transcriptional regulator [Mycolicibacterium phocaicum]SKU03320.1 transcriptional activator of acetoin/glycerol metabolism [Mycobacteroides abscessus subsp. massiliense]
MDVDDTAPAKREVRLSWRRSALSGVRPEPVIGYAPQLAEIDQASRLIAAATPVLAHMRDEFQGTGHSVLLANADCRLVYHWYDNRQIETRLSSLGLSVGADFAEDAVGTNALGTVVETRRSILLNGTDHYIKPFKDFSCYGHPIINQVTQRLEGVLNVTGPQSEANPLLAPLVAHAVSAIESNLVDSSNASERTILSAFQAASARRRRPIIAFGEDLVLANRPALDLLEPGDYAALRQLVGDLGRVEVRTLLTLTTSVQVRVRLTRIDGATEGALIMFDPRPVTRAGLPGGTSMQTDCPVLVHGFAGTGKTSEAVRIAPDGAVLDCADAALDRMWAERLRTALAGSNRIILEHLELLPTSLVAPVLETIKAQPRRGIVMTSVPVVDLPRPHATIAAVVADQVHLEPLCLRAQEMPQIAARLIKEIAPHANVRLVPSVIETLASQPWPGNLHELRAVLAFATRHRTAGDVTVSDLPPTHRSEGAVRQLAGRERAERAAIMAALNAAQGNKSRAAEYLGISRTTLYARIRALKIR